MRYKTGLWLVVVAALLSVALVGCGGSTTAGDSNENPETANTSMASETTGSASGGTVASEGESARTEEAREPAFPSPNRASGGVANRVDHIRSVRFRVFGEYERAIITFGRGGEAANRVPEWTLSRPDEGGYVRLSFPGVTSTAVAHRDFIGSALEAFYVVRDPEKGLFVDIFGTGAFTYRVSELSDPGRLIVDFRLQEEGALPPPVIRGENTVVLQPRGTEKVDGSISISGYSRHFEAANTVRLIDRISGKTLASKTVAGNDWTSAWGYFGTTLRVPRYEGLAVLEVGQESPRTGAFEGVRAPVTVRGPGG